MRLCPEAPCPVLHIKEHFVTEGGAGLVAANLFSLGVDGHCYYGSTSKKTRIFAERTLLCRMDEDSESVVDHGTYEHDLLRLATEVDAIVVSDYNKGAMTMGIADALAATGKPVFADAKLNISSLYRKAFAVFPNEHEQCSEALHQHVIRKAGARGCIVDGQRVPCEPQQVYDVTGAGDVFLAAFVWDWLQHKDLIHAAKIANRAAGESVKHLGTYVVKPSDILEPQLVGD